MPFRHCQRLVVKIGSSLLFDAEQQTINLPWLNSLIDDLSSLAKQGISILIVSSGSIACGKATLNLPKHCTIDQQQAAAAVGQIQLAHTYQKLLQQHNYQTAQLLLSLDDSENRSRYINISNTLNQLLKLNIIPIINENDSVATSEIRYGDNDRLAARVAQMIQADTLVLLSDIDGFYTDNPDINPNATIIPEVCALTPEIIAMGKDSATAYGSGGMKTKLAAAKITMDSGCRLLITAGKHQHPLTHYQKHQIGTWFTPSTSPTRAKKAWLRQHLKLSGTLHIDAGATTALKQGKSLLPVGIIRVEGHFLKGDAVKIAGSDNNILAHGLSNYSYADLQKIAGQPSDAIEAILHYPGPTQAIHCDNLVLLNQSE